MRWRTVPGFAAYQVSSSGAVRRRLPGRGTWVGRMLNPSPNDGGYLYISFSGYRISIHKLVCLVFHGPAPSLLHEAAHRNGKKLDNRARNIRWVLHQQNIDDKTRHGTLLRGTRHHAAKLTPRKVRTLRRMVKRTTLAAAGRHFGITKQAVSDIIKGKNWRHVP